LLLTPDNVTDASLTHHFFILCNEHAARYCLQVDLERASEMFDKAEILMKVTEQAG